MIASSKNLLMSSGVFSAIALLLVIGVAVRAQNNEKAVGDVISGRVITSSGESLSNARVMITQAGNTSNPQSMRADNNGAFKTEPLEPGIYYLSVYAPGYIRDTSQAVASPGYYHPGDTANFTMIKGGVITGTVKNSNGQPLVNIAVRASRVRDLEGKAPRITITARERVTDDRGVYRLYGLPPGVYVVAAGGTIRPGYTAGPSPYETDAPTYAPSTTRDSAVEVSVNNGDEITADIQYRNESGHIVSGSVAGVMKNEGGNIYLPSVYLFDLRSHMEIGLGSADITNNAFSIYGVPDGEYQVYAAQGSASGIRTTSAPKQIKVQGSDVTGIALALAPGASIGGRLIFESDAKSACGKRRTSVVTETVLYARRYEADQKSAATLDVPYAFRTSIFPAQVDAKGGFDITNVQPGSYRIDPREPAPGWFIKSITTGPAARPLSVARDGVTVKSGERVSNIAITIAEGAAQLAGKIVAAEGQSLPNNLRVYLVPSERTDQDNVFQFYEVRVDTNRSFTIDNINPGKYFIITQAAEENEYGIAKSIRLDSDFRAKVVQDAQATKKEIAFKPCEQTSAFELPLTPATSPQ